MARVNPEAPGAGAEGQPTFVARGLTKTYRTEAGEVHALRGIDLELWPGEFVVMLGPSGSGKSTFLNILGGLDSPTAGQVLYRGTDLATFSERARTRYRCEQIGFVFQFYNLIPSLTARENVMLATEIASDPLSPDKPSTSWGCPSGGIISRPRCRAASSSALPLPAPSPSDHRYSCAMSPPAPWIPAPESWCSRR